MKPVKKHFDTCLPKSALWIAVLICILALGAFLSTYFFYGPSWINGSDNYIYASEGHQLATTGTVYYGGLEDNAKLLLFAGIAVFVKLLGYSTLSASLFGILCFLGTIISIFILGKNLYNTKAGLISAFLYSIFPIVVINSSNIGDDVPMVFLVTLAVLFAVLAIKSKGKRKLRKKMYYALAGFLATISYLVVPEGAIGVLIVLTVLIGSLIFASKKTSGKSLVGLLSGIIGILLATLTIFVLGIIESGNPLSILSVVNSNLTPWSTAPGISSYLGWIFPIQLISNTAYKLYSFSHTNILATLSSFLTQNYNISHMGFGYFGFVFLICVICLLALKDKKIAVPVAWFVLALLYLSFGSQSFTRYIPVLALQRFAIILCPAVVLVIGFALTHLLEGAKSESKQMKILGYGTALFILLLLLSSSILAIRYLQYSQLQSINGLIQVGSYINTLGKNVTVFGPTDLPWIPYTNYEANLVPLGYVRYEANCTVTTIFKLQPGDFMVAPLSSDYSACGFQRVFTPTMLKYLKNYTQFDNNGLNVSDIAVYLYK